MSEKKKINENSHKAGDGNCFFDLFNLKSFGIGEHYSSGRGGIVEGDKVQVAIVRKKPGTGSRLHTHANEQFNYVLKGTLKVKVGDVEGLAPAGTLIYIPAETPHYTVATEDGDAEYYAVKDTSYLMHGEPVDGRNTGAYVEPGAKSE